MPYILLGNTSDYLESLDCLSFTYIFSAKRAKMSMTALTLLVSFHLSPFHPIRSKSSGIILASFEKAGGFSLDFLYSMCTSKVERIYRAPSNSDIPYHRLLRLNAAHAVREHAFTASTSYPISYEVTFDHLVSVMSLKMYYRLLPSCSWIKIHGMYIFSYS